MSSSLARSNSVTRSCWPFLSTRGRLRYRARTAGGYRLFRLPGPDLPRPGLVRTGDGPSKGIAVEVWTLPEQAVGALLDTVPAPLALDRIVLDDERAVTGFVAGPAALAGTDVSGYGGWRAYLGGTTRRSGGPSTMDRPPDRE